MYASQAMGLAEREGRTMEPEVIVTPLYERLKRSV